MLQTYSSGNSCNFLSCYLSLFFVIFLIQTYKFLLFVVKFIVYQYVICLFNLLNIWYIYNVIIILYIFIWMICRWNVQCCISGCCLYTVVSVLAHIFCHVLFSSGFTDVQSEVHWIAFSGHNSDCTCMKTVEECCRISFHLRTKTTTTAHRQLQKEFTDYDVSI